MPQRQVAGEEQSGYDKLPVVFWTRRLRRRVRLAALLQPPEPEQRQREEHAIKRGRAGANLAEADEYRRERDSYRASQQGDKRETGFFLHRQLVTWVWPAGQSFG